MPVAEKSSVVAPASPKATVDTDEIVDSVREKTLTTLTKAGVLREAECDGFRDYLISNEVGSGEILSVMAELRGIAEQERLATVANWGRLMAPVVKKRYALVPFADRILGSTAIFEKFPKIEEVAAAIRCPLIYAEDADVLGFGMINPVAGVAMGEFATEHLKSKNGSAPYISMFLLDLNVWETICGRQFKL